ncbi:F162B protein, partial [Polyodon spathula]|nr:F162B protein [Polyodon spathula]
FPEARPSFKVPGYRPSEFDKTLLIWTGRFKRKEDVPEQVSFEMIDAARNKVRVKACYGMVILSIVACIGMVILGKEAAGRHENLTAQNMEKKARYREEARKEREAAAIDKAQ